MSQEGESERTQRTVAELLAKYGGNSADGAPRRRRRRADDADDNDAGAIIERVMSTSGTMRPIREDEPPPRRTTHRQVRPDQQGPGSSGRMMPVQPPQQQVPPGPPARQQPPARRPPQPSQPLPAIAQAPELTAPVPPVPPAPPLSALPPAQPVPAPQQVKPPRPVDPPQRRRPQFPPNPGGVSSRLDVPKRPSQRQPEAATEQIPRMPPAPAPLPRREPGAGRQIPQPSQQLPVPQFPERFPDPEVDEFATNGFGQQTAFPGEDLDRSRQDLDFDDDQDFEADEFDSYEEDEEHDRQAQGSTREWLIMGGQLALGVVGGAAVWLGFNWLWGKVPAAALVVAIAAIAGLVWIVRRIRHADDLQTTVFAVLVGLVVTVSPAALLLLNR